MTIPGVDIINLIQLVMAVKYRASKSAYHIVCTSNCVYMFVDMYVYDVCGFVCTRHVPKHSKFSRTMVHTPALIYYDSVMHTHTRTHIHTIMRKYEAQPCMHTYVFTLNKAVLS